MRDTHPMNQLVRSGAVLLLTLGSVGTITSTAPQASAQAFRPLSADEGTDQDLTPLGADIFDGQAFDTCDAPSRAAMENWLESPYRAIGVYIGGRARACEEQPNLTEAWVKDVDAMGWRLLPVYVGSQSPCVRLGHHQGAAIDADRPREQGAAEAKDAVASAEALGMTRGTPVYLDMEDYDHTDTACAETTLAFTQGFSREIRERGYIPGFYSSATSGVAHMESARLAGATDLPDVLWYARWSVPPTITDEPGLASQAWQPHRRIHQHTGNVRETHGGTELHIDRNLVHAPVAVIR